MIDWNLFFATSVSTFKIPKRVTIFNGLAFNGDTKMNSISIDNANPNLYTDGRGVYSANKTILYYVCSAPTTPYRVSSSVEIIYDGAFVSYQAPTVELSEGITAMYSYAFFRSQITSFVMPNSVKSSGTQCFNICPNLQTCVLSKNLTSLSYSMFQNSGLTTLTIPPSVTVVNSGALANCPSLTNVYFPYPMPDLKSGFVNFSPNFVPKLSNGAKFNINNDKVMFNDDNTTVIGYFGSNETIIHLPSALKTIGEKSFMSREHIKEVVVEGICNIEKIDNYAFQGCFSLTKFPSFATIKYIGTFAFDNCQLSSAISFSKDLQWIGESAFIKNTKIPQIEFYSTGYLVISSHAFESCILLSSVSFPSSGNIYLKDYAFYLCENLRSLTITKSIISIGQSCFQSCGIQSVIFEGDTICNGIIPALCFKNCSSLASVSIPSNCTILDVECFAMTGITDIIIADNVEVLSRQCFKDCLSLESITIQSSSRLTSIQPFAFQGCGNLASVNSFVASNFCSDNGAIYNNDRSKIIIYPPAAKNKYFGCRNLEAVLIPDKSVVNIGQSAFEGCTSLKQINIPLSIKNIEANAFLGCGNIKCGVSHDNNTKEYIDMLINAGLTKKSLKECMMITCLVHGSSPMFSYNVLFPFILI
ncbi:surface antigen BspA-like [Trichomonas vaginalis G3]|uniref:Surface antigen BspA-like n=1 Tax=Trichomonas vaginalis (strain ATCC PRA-98 / G3) TaxID=412133 RepID=A2DA18_TRIV3|nr:antigen BSP-related family [Trichomonas vaginalis G3]EAY22666.1 surface antigen BspA-like [Trichomonas vaginalis G3]KAI5525480.1 antigen BSP-related family [Trichomonas vaginalis G3]|eukprot:XP_001583652.1 surface antigen BspA-like [Trichomonas vaginalis G3]